MKQGVLAAILAVQLIIVAIVWAARGSGSDEAEAFLALDAGSIDALTIEDGEATVDLIRGSDGWSLTGGLPADGDKVESVLEKLAGSSGGWPVATTDSAAERFEVTEDKFQRRIVARSGEDVVADIYLGTSPTFRKVHARHAEGGPVYSIGFSNYEAGASVSSWLDKSLLRPEGEVAALSRAGGFMISRSEDGWGTADGTPLDQEAVESLVGRFTGLNVVDTSDATLPDAPAMQFVITDATGSQTLSIYHLEEDDDYVATSDRIEGQFEVSTYIAEQMNKTLDDLVAPDEQAGDEADEGGAEGATTGEAES